jgi:hypothetical protein
MMRPVLSCGFSSTANDVHASGAILPTLAEIYAVPGDDSAEREDMNIRLAVKTY